MSENQDNQIEEEKRLLKLFRETYNEFPKGKLIKTESPDFILKLTTKRSIGIEITKLHSQTREPKENGYHTPILTKENIDFTIQTKEGKLYLYKRRKTGQIWLIITAEADGTIVPFNFTNKLGNWNFYSEFDKVFLMEVDSKKVHELTKHN